MNYKEKYKQALERAREQYNKRTPLYDIEYIFPELKESKEEKDEKVRIGLIKAFNTVGSFRWGELNVPDILAWLEKQGEKKPTDEVEPKFKVGDKVTVKGDNTIYTIGIIAPDKTCWLKHGSRAYGWATFGILKHYVE